MLLLLALRGNPIIYQGEELGLPQGHVAFEDLQDPEAIANWPHTLGRDGARTPMPWQADAPQAGFSQANRTWLKLDAAHAAKAIDLQRSDDASVASYTRDLLRLRSTLPAVVGGASQLLDTPPGIVAFVRSSDAGDVLCAFNLAREAIEWSAPGAFAQGRVIADQDTANAGASVPTRLEPRSGYWAK